MNAGLRVPADRAPAAEHGERPDEERDDHRVRILIILSWAAVVLPQVIQSLTAPQHRASVEADGPGLTRLASLGRMGLTLLLGGVALCLIVASARKARHLRPVPLVAFLTPWVYIVIRDWYISGRPSQAALLVPLVAIALWMLRPRLTSLSVLGYLTVLAAFLSIAMAVVDPPSAIFRSTGGDVVSADKEVLPWGLLCGFLTQPNSLGKFLALGLPTVFVIPRSKVRVAGVALTLFAIVWSASRTSLYAAGLACGIALALAVVRSPRARQRISALAMVASMGAVCVLPFVPTAPTAFTNRSFIWQASLPYWHLDTWFGQGSAWFRRIAKTSAAIAGSAFHGHNQLVQFLVTGGLCYAIIAGVLLWIIAVYALRQVGTDSTFGVVFFVVLAGTFALEVSFPTVDNTLMIPVVLVPMATVLFSRDNGARLQGRVSNTGVVPTIAPQFLSIGNDSMRSLRRATEKSHRGIDGGGAQW